MPQYTAWDTVPIRRERKPQAVDGTIGTLAAKDEDVDTRTHFERIYKSALFGSVLGGFCGVAYGMMDSWGTKEGRRPEKFAEAAANVRIHAAVFAGVFAGYQSAKEGFRIARGTKRTDPFDPANMIFASAVTVLPMGLHPVTRKVLPHMMFLVAVDGINEAGVKLY